MMHLTVREHDFLEEFAYAFFITLGVVLFVVAMNWLIALVR